MLLVVYNHLHQNFLVLKYFGLLFLNFVAQDPSISISLQCTAEERCLLSLNIGLFHFIYNRYLGIQAQGWVGVVSYTCSRSAIYISVYIKYQMKQKIDLNTRTVQSATVSKICFLYRTTVFFSVFYTPRNSTECLAASFVHIFTTYLSRIH